MFGRVTCVPSDRNCVIRLFLGGRDQVKWDLLPRAYSSAVALLSAHTVVLANKTSQANFRSTRSRAVQDKILLERQSLYTRGRRAVRNPDEEAKRR